MQENYRGVFKISQPSNIKQFTKVVNSFNLKTVFKTIQIFGKVLNTLISKLQVSNFVQTNYRIAFVDKYVLKVLCGNA